MVLAYLARPPLAPGALATTAPPGTGEKAGGGRSRAAGATLSCVMGLGALGRFLVVVGLVLVLVGLALVAAERFPGLRIGRLPGDIRVERPGFSFYFPLATSVLVSVAITIVLWIVRRLR